MGEKEEEVQWRVLHCLKYWACTDINTNAKFPVENEQTPKQ
jgi:hypothetical protein